MTSKELDAIREHALGDGNFCPMESGCPACLANQLNMAAVLSRIISCPCGRHHSLVTGSPIEQRRDLRDIN